MQRTQIRMVNHSEFNQPRGSLHFQQFIDDWNNRELITLITDNVQRISEFLTQFELSCKGKLAILDNAISSLERKVEYLDATVTHGDTLS